MLPGNTAYGKNDSRPIGKFIRAENSVNGVQIPGREPELWASLSAMTLISSGVQKRSPQDYLAEEILAPMGSGAPKPERPRPHASPLPPVLLPGGEAVHREHREQLLDGCALSTLTVSDFPHPML